MGFPHVHSRACLSGGLQVSRQGQSPLCPLRARRPFMPSSYPQGPAQERHGLELMVAKVLWSLVQAFPESLRQLVPAPRSHSPGSVMLVTQPRAIPRSKRTEAGSCCLWDPQWHGQKPPWLKCLQVSQGRS